MRRILPGIGLWLLASTFTCSAATVDTVEVYSDAMKKNVRAAVIKPGNYSSARPLPVVYFLHGLLGSYKQFLQSVPEFADYADKYNILIVCPDGSAAGWYFDSPVNNQSRYETHISSEIVSYVDSHYNTVKNRKGRAIAGGSMGGHGAFYIAFKHQDIFGAAGSISGCVDIRAYPKMFAIQNVLGDYAEYPQRWEENTVINLTHLLTPYSLALIFDCGSEDMFADVNKALHQKMLNMNIPHHYISRPGGHTFEYMTTAIGFQMLFISNFFSNR
ncbi:esterase family protein [Mucilaginibacter hurinus]|uniref:Esterase family protein n=1 Tax=Mucilaginibacter hurinus TaxID=2201324 RepID=A0A367GSI3_9SPHI|nr:alpha/beta hydrolase family protein [Mucilaginibacter hurinus]RCH56055.1 esterase family protein [Mucilaginibacter hurinus]